MGPVSHLVDRLVFESEGRGGATRQATPAVHRLKSHARTPGIRSY
jgi:hypothetical protein